MVEEVVQDEEGVAVMGVEAVCEEDCGVDGVDSENDGSGGNDADEADVGVEDGAVEGRLSAATRRLTNRGRRGDGAVDTDDAELTVDSAGDTGIGQCGRPRMHTGDTRMDSGRLAIADSSASTLCSSATPVPVGSRHSDATLYDQWSSSSLSACWAWRLRLERGEGVTGGAEVQRVRLR